MDEVDGSSRDTSTDGSSGGFSHSRPELHMKSSEAMLQHHSSSSRPRGEINYSPQLRGHNISRSEGTSVDRTDSNGGPTAASCGLHQFGSEFVSRSVKLEEKRNVSVSSLTSFSVGGSTDSKLSETKLPLRRQSRAESRSEFLFREDEPSRSVKLDEKVNVRDSPLNSFSVGGSTDSKLSETKLPLRRQSRAESRSEFLFREDELPLLRSEEGRPRPDSRCELELKSDLNSQYDSDIGENDFLPRLEGEVTEPHQQVNLREHLPKPEPTTQKEANTDRNVRMQGMADCQLSVTGSFVQQCSDFNDFESYSQFYRECYGGRGNALAAIETRDVYNGAGHLERVIQTQDELLRARDQELLQLKEANHRQSMFIEKTLSEKRYLEATVVEQARLLMSSHGAQRVSTEPGRQAVISSVGTFDAQLYEAQLATYKEDFENERKEKLLIKGSTDSLRDQLQKALSELRLAQDKLKKTEEELERIKNPYRAAYQPYFQNFSNHSNITASSSRLSQSAAAAAQNKTSLYRKPDHLEPDRINQTVSTMSTEIDHLSHVATDYEAKVNRNDLIRADRPCSTEKPQLIRSSHLCQKNQTGTATRPHGQEHQVNNNELKSSGRSNKVEEMSLRQGQRDWMSHSDYHILAY